MTMATTQAEVFLVAADVSRRMSAGDGDGTEFASSRRRLRERGGRVSSVVERDLRARFRDPKKSRPEAAIHLLHVSLFAFRAFPSRLPLPSESSTASLQNPNTPSLHSPNIPTAPAVARRPESR